MDAVARCVSCRQSHSKPDWNFTLDVFAWLLVAFVSFLQYNCNGVFCACRERHTALIMFIWILPLIDVMITCSLVQSIYLMLFNWLQFPLLSWKERRTSGNWDNDMSTPPLLKRQYKKANIVVIVIEREFFSSLVGMLFSKVISKK